MRGAIAVLALAASAACAQQQTGPVVGWTTNPHGATSADAGNFLRYIVSGPPDAVDEFTADAVNAEWTVEARAVSSPTLVFVQFRAPNTVGHTTYFTDKYLLQKPRRINFAPVIAKVDDQ